MDITMLVCRGLTRLTCLGGLGALLVGMAVAWAADASWPGPLGQVTVPLYASESARAVGVLRIQRLRLDSERRGFLRIGVLPMLVAEDVRLEADQVGDGARLLSQAEAVLHTQGVGRKLELRKVRCRFGGETPIELHCGRLVPATGGWLATEGVRWEGGGIRRHGESARIETDGAGGWRVAFQPAAERPYQRVH